ncbi:Uncharacterised protein [uncultured Clostridium sp.]|nr:Uncharacterised protein [uncultured Clostridium sp.]
MKDWILAIFIIALAFILLSTLDSDPSMQVSVKTTEGTTYQDFGVDMLQKLDGGLYYDQTTGIVYFWNGVFSIANNSTTPTPYYSENGKLYRYDPVSNTMEEVK